MHGIDAAHELKRGCCLLPDPAEAIQSDFWRENSGDPERVQQESPGREPWEQAEQQRKPQRGDAVVPVSKRLPL